ncbi:MAG: cysteine-rich KTR domain-containing protein [Clostridia bacterium]|nr:cysteine-rich KTR domain-containing protein [Clostridia bacterium]
MNYYVVCPDCGYKLLKAGNGSNIEIYCPKCKAKLLISVNDDKVLIQKQAADKT